MIKTKRTFARTALLASASLALVHGAKAYTWSAAVGSSQGGVDCEDLAFSTTYGTIQDQSNGLLDTTDPENTGFFPGAQKKASLGTTPPAGFGDCVTAPGFHLIARAFGPNDSTNLKITVAPQNWYDPGLQDLVDGSFSAMDVNSLVAGTTYGTTLPCPFEGTTTDVGSASVTDCGPACGTGTNAGASGGTCVCSNDFYGSPLDASDDTVGEVTKGCTACPFGGTSTAGSNSDLANCGSPACGTGTNAGASGGTCVCSDDFYGSPLDASDGTDGEVTKGCTACPTNSNSEAGSGDLEDCKCATNFYPSSDTCVACASGTTRAGTVSVTGTATCSAAAESAGASTPIAVALAAAAAVPLLL